MAKQEPPKARDKNRKRRRYVTPRVVKHGELTQTALAHSY